ncbi:uncharacterized protein CPUR_03006 [Claviceps purpurea 20.1]|uniref:F-box domain-containing protein n=1 Tax=Claviceps purpurea (strain 20.1) TaxID=1111077 RepID=M1W8I8_CLAP2|nr:uncharacterized protein CPUR_03006 [Claviceps purpurea 20.1]
MAALVESRRQSPLCLPAGVVTKIFLYLNFSEIILSLRVCKEWNRTLTSPLHSTLWRNLEVPNNCMMRWWPSHADVAKMLSWAGHGGANRIVMGRRDTARATLTLVLNESPNLEHLEYTQPVEDLLLPSDEQLCKQLRNVSIHGSETAFRNAAPDVPGGFPRTFLQNAASSLEHLAFEGIPLQWQNTELEPEIPFLPKLKTLRIKESSITGLPLPLFHLSDAFPGLEQLFVSQASANLDPGPMPELNPSRKWETIWPKLKVFLFEANITTMRYWLSRSFSPVRFLTCLSRGDLLQHIRLDFGHQGWPCMFMYGDIHDDYQRSELQSLRSFRSCKLRMEPERARCLFSSAIRTERLSSFDIVFPPNSLDYRESINHLHGYGWLRGAPSIVTLGCYDFFFPIWPENDEDLHLPQFLATFPNLQTLSIRSTRYTILPFTYLVEVILRLTHLKTIYINDYQNHPNVNLLRRAAAEQGVELITEERPQQWPMPLSS